MAHDDEIRLIAYSIWEEEGCPNGRDCEHWFRAEIIWEDQQKQQPKPAAAVKTAAKPAARRTAKKAGGATK